MAQFLKDITIIEPCDVDPQISQMHDLLYQYSNWVYNLQDIVIGYERILREEALSLKDLIVRISHAFLDQLPHSGTHKKSPRMGVHLQRACSNLFPACRQRPSHTAQLKSTAVCLNMISIVPTRDSCPFQDCCSKEQQVHRALGKGHAKPLGRVRKQDDLARRAITHSRFHPKLSALTMFHFRLAQE